MSTFLINTTSKDGRGGQASHQIQFPKRNVLLELVIDKPVAPLLSEILGQQVPRESSTNLKLVKLPYFRLLDHLFRKICRDHFNGPVMKLRTVLTQHHEANCTVPVHWSKQHSKK